MNEELIQQARELCGKATPGMYAGCYPSIGHRGYKIAQVPGDVIAEDVYEKADVELFINAKPFILQLCDALEAAEKEISYERILKGNYKSRAEKAEAERDAVIEDFQDFATSGIYNMNPYCGNRCAECTDGRGWCIDSHCKGFKVAIEPPKGE